MGKKVTIYDLAQKLNVSPATVSRGLNNHPSISDGTKKKIVAVAKASGYRINTFAVNLRKQKSNTIGIIVPKLNSYFMSTILAGVEKVANDSGYNLIISQSLESMEKEKLNAQTLYNSGVDALLVSLAYDTVDYTHYQPYIQNKIPLIFIDRVPTLEDCPTIVIDNQLAGFEATEHLISQGCKNILYIGGNLKQAVYSERFLGYKAALKAHMLHFRETNALETNLDPKKAKDIVTYIKKLKRPIDGIFITSDTFAANCLKELKKRKYKVPEDIKVIGFNNDPISELISPALSTIDYPGYEMGVLAAQSIISHLNGNINLQSANSISLRHRLIIRDSTKQK